MRGLLEMFSNPILYRIDGPLLTARTVQNRIVGASCDGALTNLMYEQCAAPGAGQLQLVDGLAHSREVGMREVVEDD
jgi:hypothetical protein